MNTMNSLAIKKKILSFFGSRSNSGKSSFVISYIHNRHRIPNFKNPRDLSEIWIKRVLDGEVNNYYTLADKYAVREYVKSKNLGGILTPLIGVYDNAEDIDFNRFPDKFALKANFGAGMNIICTDKSTLDFEGCRKRVTEWLRPRTYSLTERHYNLIPHKVICEDFIDDGAGGFPVDFKFMCIRGKVHCILACSGRERGHADYLPYSTDWKPLYDYYRSINDDIQLLHRPNNLSEMIDVAEKLAEDIDLVRIDLYSSGSRIWFGEITLTPSGCLFHRWSMKALVEMGKIYRNAK